MMKGSSAELSSMVSVPLPPRTANAEAIDAVGHDVVHVMDGEDLDWVVTGFDKANCEAPSIEKEMRRLAVLKSYRVIGSGRDEGYEQLISLTSRIFKAPMALVSVIDLGRQYFLASRGFGDMKEQSRKSSICAHAIISKHDLLIIPDLTKDDRFMNSEEVTGESHLRFYASAPMTCPEGYRLGTLCILDTEPRPEGLTLGEKQNLSELAGMIMDVMVEHRERKNHEFRHPAQLIASTSNDLMTPLMGVVSGLSTLGEDEELLGSLSRQQKEVVTTAVTCSSVMNRICKISVEAFKKERSKVNQVIDANEKESKQSLLNVRDIVKHLHMVMEPFPKQVPLIITTDEAVPPIVVADDLKVFRSVVNYLTNACAKTEKGSVHLKIYVKENEDDSAPQSRHLVFAVEDTGTGVRVANYQYIFKPIVVEADPLDGVCSDSLLDVAKTGASKAVMERTGLGLYSVATQISSIGGKYGFRPRGFMENGSQSFNPDGSPLSGSVFWFSVPLVLPDDTQQVASTNASHDTAYVENGDTLHQKEDDRVWNKRDEAASIASDEKFAKIDSKRSPESLVAKSTEQRKRRILLVEDSLVCRKVMSKILNKLGFDVVQAVNGMEGLRAMQATLFDLVLCDFLMPVMDGMDCILQYRQFEVAHRPWFDQFIVGMSAHASEKDVERGLRVGMNDYKPKPVTLKVLREILESQEFHYVSTRLDAITTEVEDGDTRAAKRQRLESHDLGTKGDHTVRVCLVAAEGELISKLSEKAAEDKGWKAIVVRDGEAALRLLQMRNWDAVLLDDELPGITSSRCMKHFREWEKKNRVNRQKNVVQMSSSFIPSHLEPSSSVQLPSGFDGAIGKPLSLQALQTFLDKAAEGTACLSHDIVSR
jgi:CheY-like chemotaxis protein/GAF domain-containing protein